MVFIILGAAIGVLISLLFMIDDPVDGIISLIFLPPMCSILGFMVAMVVGAIAFGSMHEVKGRPVPLHNIVDNNTTRGHFFLGSGNIDGIPQYSWYEETAPDTYERRDVDADMATIHLYDGTPHYVATKAVSNYGFWNTWGVNVGYSSPYETHYDFYIPRGSITRDYELDAK